MKVELGCEPRQGMGFEQGLGFRQKIGVEQK